MTGRRNASSRDRKRAGEEGKWSCGAEARRLTRRSTTGGLARETQILYRSLPSDWLRGNSANTFLLWYLILTLQVRLRKQCQAQTTVNSVQLADYATGYHLIATAPYRSVGRLEAGAPQDVT